MSWLYRCLLRPALFTQQAESIHNRTMGALGWASHHPLIRAAIHSVFGAPDLPVRSVRPEVPQPGGPRRGHG